MSGFSYKGVDIYTITNGSNTTGSTIPGYNLKGTKTNYTGLRPKDFGLSYGGKSIAEDCTASYTFFTQPQTYKIPSDCKSIRFAGLGGGGGKGGDGGTATQYAGSTSSYPGGSGGVGGYGTLSTSQSPISVSGGDNISITIGSGGSKGNRGYDESCSNDRTKTTHPDWAMGGTGNPGGPGNSSTIIYQNETLLNAGGGNGGGGGKGGIVGAGAGKNKGPGKQGDQGNSKTAPSAGNFGYQTNYGGGPGTDGYVQIIWLYD